VVPALEELREEREELRMTMTKFDDSIRMFALTQTVRQQPQVPPPAPAPISGIPMFAAGIAVAASLLAIVLLVRSLPSSASPASPVAAGAQAAVMAPPELPVAAPPAVTAAAPLAVPAEMPPDPAILALAAPAPPVVPAPAPGGAPVRAGAPVARPPETAADAAKRAAARKKAEEQAAGAEKLVKLGELSFQTGKSENAVSLFRSAIGTNPKLPSAHKGLATVLMFQGKQYEAKHEYETYLRLAPNAPDADQIKRVIAGM
jgi:tetratricopeptide (TPR) repeat protein